MVGIVGQDSCACAGDTLQAAVGLVPFGWHCCSTGQWHLDWVETEAKEEVTAVPWAGMPVPQTRATGMVG